jgi:hypothetical protein
MILERQRKVGGTTDHRFQSSNPISLYEQNMSRILSTQMRYLRLDRCALMFRFCVYGVFDGSCRRHTHVCAAWYTHVDNNSAGTDAMSRDREKRKGICVSNMVYRPMLPRDRPVSGVIFYLSSLVNFEAIFLKHFFFNFWPA